jgi:hypothetical protein
MVVILACEDATVTTFGDLDTEFRERVRRAAWCTVATIDPKGELRSRILHRLWEGTTGPGA